ncbi:hypothetical protein L21SP2_2744 [Salinispira pacifica]|uniref:Uncharacterized protein n=2 Tax=Salinispira pacifica TaxID=1307761 RepID=V5WKM7_9SPIO|nr:hypothetical protein L21SP2_2744 [Salinispira pacifica]
MQIMEMNRLISYDALFATLAVMVVLHILLIRARRWRALVLFHSVGAVNTLVEFFMVNRGIRVLQGEMWARTLALFELAWLDSGWFVMLTYLNSMFLFRLLSRNRHAHTRQGRTLQPARLSSSGQNLRPMDSNFLMYVNLLFFAGMVLASINYGVFDGSVLARRIFQRPRLVQTYQILSVAIPFVGMIFLGFKRVALVVLVQGVIYGSAFQFRLLLGGIRQASVARPWDLMVDAMTLASSLIVTIAFFSVLMGIIDMDRHGDRRRLGPAARWIRIRIAAVQQMRRSGQGALLWLPVLVSMYVRKTLGRLWKDLPPASDWKDRQSRGLVSDAVLMYRELLKRLPAARALDIIREIIYVSAMRFLSDSIPVMGPDFFKKSEAQLEEDVISLVDRFPNTDYRLDTVKYPRLRYLVTKCRFVDLVHQLGHPELATAFCAADGAFFVERQPMISMDRPKTIAEGYEICDFDFTVTD